MNWKRNLAVTWVSQVFSLSGFGFVIPFLPFYLQEVGGLSELEVRAWAGVIASAPALSMALMAPIWGIVADRFGRKLMLQRAMVAGSAIMLLMTRATTVEAVVVLRVVQGLFTGTVGASAALVASGTPEDRMGWALGVVSSSNFVGFSLGPLIGGLTVEAFGYRAGFFVGATVLALGFVLVTALVREPARGAPRPVAERPPHARGGIRGAVTPASVALFGSVFLLRFARTAAIPFMPLMVQEFRGTLEGTAAATGLVQAGAGLATAAAGLSLGRLGDRLPPRRLIVALFSIAAVIALPIFVTGSVLSFGILYIAMAFVLGGVEPNLQSELSRRTPPERRGLLFGIQTTVGNMGWATAPLVGSAVSVAWGVPAVFLTTALVLAITGTVGTALYGFPFPLRRSTAA